MCSLSHLPIAEPIRSEYRADPDFQELLEEFVSEVPGRRTDLERAYLRWDIAQLRAQAHHLKGSAVGYGFGGLSRLAATLEDACKRIDPSEVAEHLRQTLQYLARISV